jgi:hypothetical protein
VDVAVHVGFEMVHDFMVVVGKRLTYRELTGKEGVREEAF